jgi:transposase
MVYSEAFQRRMIKRLSGPPALSASALSKEVGVSQPTLSKWLREASTIAFVSKKKLKKSPSGPRRPSDWPAEDKLRVVNESASLTGTDLGAYLRREGLHEDDLVRFREAALSGLTEARKPRSGPTDAEKRIKALERELRRKEAALAETAALLVLRKKLNALWGEEGEDT